MVDQESLRFGNIGIELGFLKAEQVGEAIEIQKKMEEMGLKPKRMGEILIEKGYLTEDQARKIFWVQGQRGGHLEIAGYKIVAKIGQGSMGAVYKAVQLSMQRYVALKILSPHLSQNQKYVERFITEARAVAKLNHQNIISGYDVGVSNGVYYFAMEFVEGPTVGDILKRGGSMDEKRSANIILHVARALEYASKNGILHRDIKPDNIVLTRGGPAKLCDLGLAKLPVKSSIQSTEHGVSLGTPNYISPEQARGKPDVDVRSDIYSLGATFYHMITGQVPFPGESAMAVIAKQLTEEPIPPREINPLISPQVESIVLKMIQKNKNLRYQTPTDLISDLQKVTVDEEKEEKIAPLPSQPKLHKKISKLHRFRRSKQ